MVVVLHPRTPTVLVSPWLVRWLPICLALGIHAALLADSSRYHFAPVGDEYGQLPAGHSYWRLGRFSAYDVNPPLTKLLGTIPIACEDLAIDYRSATKPDGDLEFMRLGVAFENATDRRYFTYFARCRFVSILFSCLCGFFVFHWSRRLYGDGAGMLSLALWCLCPNVLGHGYLVTPDIGSTLAGFAATYGFARILERPRFGDMIVAGVLMGIAQLSKFTLLVLYPAWLAIALIVRQTARPQGAASDGRDHPLRFLLGAGAVVGISLLVLNAGYLFEGSFYPLGKYPFVSEMFRGESPPDWDSFGTGNRFQGTPLGKVPVPLPRHYLQGIDRQNSHFESGLFSYMNGTLARHGWWYYYLFAFAIKTPVTTMIFLVLAVIGSLFGGASRRPGECALVVPPLAILGFVSSQTGFNHHLRYVLPIYPFLLAYAGSAACLPDVLAGRSRGHLRGARPAFRGMVLLIALAGAISVLRIHPHELSYFNEFIGGPDRGHLYLSNSNIDWGQDLPGLARWLDRHPEAEPIGLAYYGFVNPRTLGIRTRPVPRGPLRSEAVNKALSDELGPLPGWYAVSVTLLHGMPFGVRVDRQDFAEIPAHSFEYFQYLKPVAKIGYSLFIYHVTIEDANHFRRSMRMPSLEPKPMGVEYRSNSRSPVTSESVSQSRAARMYSFGGLGLLESPRIGETTPGRPIPDKLQNSSPPPPPNSTIQPWRIDYGHQCTGQIDCAASADGINCQPLATPGVCSTPAAVVGIFNTSIPLGNCGGPYDYTLNCPFCSYHMPCASGTAYKDANGVTTSTASCDISVCDIFRYWGPNKCM